MCSECLQSTCAGACPNAPEPKVFAWCDCCDGEIRYGDKCYKTDNRYVYCTDCITKVTAEED